ncbi:sensor histidine kinase [Aquiflexum sp.]|uniref:sensor histidine kinase n=1 Tax=Aquiflexum sp. TaxID=1872584 RepID=UPI0035934AE0
MFDHRFKFIFPALLAIYSFLNILVLEGDRLYQVELPAVSLLYIIFFLSYAVWFANFGIEKFVIKTLHSIHPLLVQFGFSIFAALLISLMSVYFTGLILGGPFTYSWQNFLLTSGFTFRINLFLNCINAIYFFSQRFKEKAVEAEKLQTLNVAAKLESLHGQINPHFFFNNLSALSVLIHQDIKAADEYLQKLSNIYRYILNNKDQELVMLSEEMNFLENYIDLLSIRFQSSLTFNLEVDKQCTQFLIPPAVLQLLVENVVKHNYFTKSEPLEVVIKSDCETISIFNKKQLKEALELSTGIGLQNISDRYKFLNYDVLVFDTPDYFKVELPLIKTHENSDRRGRTFGLAKN